MGGVWSDIAWAVIVVSAACLGVAISRRRDAARDAASNRGEAASSAAAATPSAADVECPPAVPEQEADLPEREASTRTSPWRVDQRDKDRFVLVNTAGETARNVRIDASEIWLRVDPRLSADVKAGDWVHFAAFCLDEDLKDTITVTWEAGDGQEVSREYQLPR